LFTGTTLTKRGAQKRFPVSVRRLLGLLLPLSLTVRVLGQDDLDSVKVDPEHHKVVFENDQVRVVRWVVPVGDKTLMHSHPESLIIGLTDYNGRVTTGDGQISEVRANTGSVSWRPALIHSVENIGSQPMEGIIVEPGKPAWTQSAGAHDDLDSVKVDPAHHEVVFENDQVRVVRWVIPLGEKTLMHSHPESLIIDLTDYNGRVTMGDGQISEVRANAGSVSWRPAVTHAVENIGSQPMEGIIVEPMNPDSKSLP